MQPMKPVNFASGPAVTPSAPLLAWLENDVKPADPRKRIKLPVTLNFDALGFGDCFVGAGEDKLLIQIDDTAMGISLLEQVRDADTGCTLWLEGYWGSLVPDPMDIPLPGEKRWPFAVLKKHDAIDDPSQPPTAFVEA